MNNLSACSEEISSDGIARIILKNHYPCVYLSNGKSITRIQFSEQTNQSGFIPIYTDGSSREQCILIDNQYGTIPHNQPVDLALSDDQFTSLSNAHIANFCIENQNNQLRLVRVIFTEQGKQCSNQAWKPTKDYIGLFGKIEQFIDWLFNLNGYTKETF